MVQTYLNIVLAHPGKGLHRLGGISVFGTISGGICHVLFRDCIVTVAHGLLDQIGALRHCHVE